MMVYNLYSRIPFATIIGKRGSFVLRKRANNVL